MVWPPDPGAIGLPVQALDTSALILDLDAVERNLDRMDRALATASPAPSHAAPTPYTDSNDLGDWSI